MKHLRSRLGYPVQIRVGGTMHGHIVQRCGTSLSKQFRLVGWVRNMIFQNHSTPLFLVPCYSCSSCNSQNNKQLRLTSKWWTPKSSSHWMTQKFASFVTRLAATMDDLLYDGPSLTCAHQNDSLAPTFMCTYLHVHKQPFRVYLFRGHGGDLGFGGDLGTRRRE